MAASLQGTRLRRAIYKQALLIAAVLAIAAGIFGMHVMTGGNHAEHSPTVAPAVAHGTTDGHADVPGAAHAPTGGHANHPTAADDTATGSKFQHSSLSEPQSCTCPTECSGAHTMGTECVPSAKSGSLKAPQPGAGALAFNSGCGSSITPTAAYGYLPESPSPGELSISRT
jgi:hypothetical protein